MEKAAATTLLRNAFVKLAKEQLENLETAKHNERCKLTGIDNIKPYKSADFNKLLKLCGNLLESF